MITNVSKTQKKKRSILNLLLGYLTLVMGYKTYLCNDFSSVNFINQIPFFPGIVWIDKLHDLMKGFFSYKGCHGNRKNTFFQLS